MLCCASWCGPPLPVTVASTCSWLGHPVSGLIPYTYFALFRLAFTVAPSLDLTLHQKLTRWIVLQKARRHGINPLRLLVGAKFQDLFHSPPGVLFTFPSLYQFTIDRILYLALAGGPAGFRQGFSCPALLDKTHIRSASFSRTRLSRPLVSHSNYSANHAVFLPYPKLIDFGRKSDSLNCFKRSDLVVCNFTTPYKYSPISLSINRNLKGLGYSSFARHYFRNHFLFSLPHPTKMFQFRWFPPNFLFYSEAGDTT